MQIIEKDPAELIPYENNPRYNDNAVPAVAASIKEFGFKVPIIIDKNGVIVAGHTRHKAALQLKLQKVPCIIADDLTDTQIKAYRLADNKVGELAEWNDDFMFLELSELDALGVDMLQFGFEDPLEREERTETTEDEAPEPDEENEPTVKRGELWQLGEHRLICGDSTDAETLEKLMNGAEADLIITDPPYNVDYEGKTKDALKIQNDKMSDNNFYCFLHNVFENINDIAKPGAAIYVFYADRETVNFINAFKAVDFHLAQVLIWNKNTLVLGLNDYHWKHEPILYGWKPGTAHYFTNSRCETSVINADKPPRSAEHPTMKPVKLVSYLIENSSRRGEIVVDVFGGSGSTLIAAEQTGRRCFTCELDPKYCDVIIKRWEDLTGQKAVRL